MRWLCLFLKLLRINGESKNDGINNSNGILEIYHEIQCAIKRETNR